MRKTKKESALLPVRSNVGLCHACNGNDGDMPCAYPSEGKQGCLRDDRLESMEPNRQIRFLRSCWDFATWYKGA